MVDKQIRVLQNELNRMVDKNEDYQRIYELSTRLDELIVKHYRNNAKDKA